MDKQLQERKHFLDYISDGCVHPCQIAYDLFEDKYYLQMICQIENKTKGFRVAIARGDGSFFYE